ncbi:MAG: hypothetical protein E7412_08150, partial [Ruminococcaceae bacterium]|nr:hypothetical protein [Oscillospiraceae bacterium]
MRGGTYEDVSEYVVEVKNDMNEKISKEKLTEVLDGLHLQIVWVWLCLDSLDAIRSLGNERMKIAKNFFYITHSSLIYRYSMELAKLLDEKEGLSIYRIKNMCAQNNEYFDNSFDVNEYCKAFKKALNQHSLLIKNLRERRCKTYAHNDENTICSAKRQLLT